MYPEKMFTRRSALAWLLCLTMMFALWMPQLVAAQALPLMLGDSGEDVRTAQERLIELGYLSGSASGDFDEATQDALVAFQEQHGLLKSGMLDELTRQQLLSPQARPYEPRLQREATEDTLMMSGMPYIAPGSIMGEPVMNTNEYGMIDENGFVSVSTSPLSTFAADVDTASYAQLRAMILRGEEVPVDSVRIEEMLNYFRYDYKPPQGDEPFGVTMELAPTPWNEDTLLLLIGLQAKELAQEERPGQNLVFLIDVSGSMNAPDKLPLVKRAFLMLLEELAPEDRISIVTYASREQVVLSGMKASEKTAIMAAIDSLEAGGATAGAAGISTAYELVAQHFLPEGNNRVLLATDGDLNVGISDEGSLARLVMEKKQGGIFLSVLGFGDGNYKDNKLEALADHGDGNYSYIDTIHEARKALVQEIGATFFTVAKDVKLQVDFNPAKLKGYRLIGYENRLLSAEDFADDSKDGGELGSGHRLSVLYELVPLDSPFEFGQTQSKYDAPEQEALEDAEWLTLSIRAKEPKGEESLLYSYPLEAQETEAMSSNLRFAAAIAQTGMLLRDSEWKGSASFDSTLELLREDAGLVGDPYKEEFLYLVTLLDRQEP